MAISATHYMLLRELRTQGVLPQGGSILEIGMANFYGDLDPKEIHNDLEGDPDMQQHLKELCSRDDLEDRLFRIARVIYDAIFAPSSVTAIDMDTAAVEAHKWDLNELKWFTGDTRFKQAKFATVINHGTAEHIFNIANVFRVMHDACKSGGLMIHESPFTGWVDHGFYCLQPTLFYDLAESNGYDLVGMWTEHLRSKSYLKIESREHVHRLTLTETLPNNAMLFVVFRKLADEPFKIPQQHVYSQSATPEAVGAWKELR